jgi:hypothetical protein
MHAHSDSIGKIATALAAAQLEMPHAPTRSKNAHLRNTYADLPTIIETVRPVLNKHGISVLQRAVASPPGTVAVSTLLVHSSGEWLGDEGVVIPYSAQKGVNIAQSAGSALTYARRYGLAALISLAQADDDGHAAGSPEIVAQPPQETGLPLSKAQADELRGLLESAGADPDAAKRYVEATTAETFEQRVKSVRNKAAAKGKLDGFGAAS